MTFLTTAYAHQDDDPDGDDGDQILPRPGNATVGNHYGGERIVTISTVWNGIKTTATMVVNAPKTAVSSYVGR